MSPKNLKERAQKLIDKQLNEGRDHHYFEVTSVRRDGDGVVIYYIDRLLQFAYGVSPELNRKPRLHNWPLSHDDFFTEMLIGNKAGT